MEFSNIWKMHLWPTPLINPPLINPVDPLFLSVSMYGYLYYTLVISKCAVWFHCMATENPQWTPELFSHISNFVMSLFLSITLVSMRDPRTVYIFCLHPRISYFSKEPLFLLLDNNVRNRSLGMKCASYYEIVFIMALLSSQNTEIHLYIYDKHIVE